MRTFLRSLSAIAFAFVVFNAHSDPRNAEQPVKIGVIGPLTGPVANWGIDVQRVLLFARDQLEATNVEFIFEDDRCLGKDAHTAAQKVIAMDRVDLAVVVCSESLLTTAPIFEKSRITVITPSATAASISRSGDFIFRTFPQDGSAANLLAAYLVKRHTVVGILSELRGYSQELAAATLEALPSSVTLISEEFTSTDSDVRAQLLRLKRKSVEALILNPNSDDRFLEVLHRAKEVLPSVPIYGFHFPGDKSFLPKAGPIADGITFVALPRAEESFSTTGLELFKLFESEHGPIQSADFVFASTFEAFRLLMSGSDQQSLKSDLRSYLYSGTFGGIFGQYAFDKQGDILGVHHGLYRIVSGHPEAIQRLR